MKLHELAAEVDKRTPELLTLCEGLGIEATWAGSDLSDEDAARIREALGASGAPAATSPETPAADAAPAEEGAPTEAVPAAVGATPASSAPPIGTPAGPPRAPAGPAPVLGGGAAPLLTPPGMASVAGGAAGENYNAGGGQRVLDYNVTDALKSLLFGLILGVAGRECVHYAGNWNDWKLIIPGGIAFVLSALFFVAAIIEGAKAVGSIRRLPNRRKGTAVAIVAIVVAVGLLAPLCIVGWNAGQEAKDEYDYDHSTTTNPASTTTNINGEINKVNDQNRVSGDYAIDLRVGACYTYSQSDRVGVSYLAAGCTNPHSAEKVGEVSLGGPKDPFPSQAAIDAKFKSQCPALAHAYTGVVFDLAYVAPTKDLWNRGYRLLACLIQNPAGNWTVSVKGK